MCKDESSHSRQEKRGKKEVCRSNLLKIICLNFHLRHIRITFRRNTENKQPKDIHERPTTI